jgi:hypothetical protein
MYPITQKIAKNGALDKRENGKETTTYELWTSSIRRLILWKSKSQIAPKYWQIELFHTVSIFLER